MQEFEGNRNSNEGLDVPGLEEEYSRHNTARGRNGYSQRWQNVYHKGDGTPVPRAAAVAAAAPTRKLPPPPAAAAAAAAAAAQKAAEGTTAKPRATAPTTAPFHRGRAAAAPSTADAPAHHDALRHAPLGGALEGGGMPSAESASVCPLHELPCNSPPEKHEGRCHFLRLRRTCEAKRRQHLCEGSWGCQRTCYGCEAAAPAAAPAHTTTAAPLPAPLPAPTTAPATALVPDTAPTARWQARARGQSSAPRAPSAAHLGGALKRTSAVPSQRPSPSPLPPTPPPPPPRPPRPRPPRAAAPPPHRWLARLFGAVAG